jgi:hypothetical protein
VWRRGRLFLRCPKCSLRARAFTSRYQSPGWRAGGAGASPTHRGRCRTTRTRFGAAQQSPGFPCKIRTCRVVVYGSFLVTENMAKTKSTEQQRELRRRINEKYGSRCVQCGFADVRALHIDHVDSGGQQQELRRGWGGGMSYYYRVLKDETGKYQLLCANCNAIKRSENNEARGMTQHIGWSP